MRFVRKTNQLDHYYRHGCRKRPGYKSWYKMMGRCYDQNSDSYKNYGGRGIVVCDRWHNIKSFFEDMGDKPFGLTLERIDNDGDYELSNCKWATREEQAQNRRRSGVLPRLIEYNGTVDSVKGWAERFGIARTTLTGKLRQGCTLEDIEAHYT